MSGHKHDDPEGEQSSEHVMYSVSDQGTLLWQSVHLNSPKFKQAMRNCSLLQWRYVLFEQLQFTAVVAALNIV
jgi:hypothetical protein